MEGSARPIGRRAAGRLRRPRQTATRTTRTSGAALGQPERPLRKRDESPRAFGQRVVAVASLNEPGAVAEQALIDHTREHLSGYKLPKQVLLVEEVRRAANGKADYKWATTTARAKLES